MKMTSNEPGHVRRIIAAAVAVAGLLTGIGYALHAKRGDDPPGAPGASGPASGVLPQSIAAGEAATRRHIERGIKAGDLDPETGRKVLYYHDPMVPGNRFDQPAKSPFMDMMLVPVYAGGEDDAGRLSVSPRIQQNLGLRTAQVERGQLAPEVVAVGAIAYDERDQVVLQARAAGFVERLHVRATLDPVRRGQPLLALYVPEWVAAQEEYLALRAMAGSDLAPLRAAALARMRQLGMDEAQIRAVEASGQVQSQALLAAPIAGVLSELAVREGMAVAPGTTLLRINGVTQVWAYAEVPESQAALLRPGVMVEAASPALPGVRITGRVQAILPEVDPTTRTLKARMALANPGARLAPGMAVSMRFAPLQPASVLRVPSDAVIQTGRRTVVMLAEDDGHFRPQEVEAGLESAGWTEIRRGLRAGQRVVVSAQFLIDSEASLRGLEARLNREAVDTVPPEPGVPEAAP